MAIRFACRCGKKLKAPDEKIGKRVLCPACGNPVTVPEENTVAVEEIASSSANLAGDLLRRSAETRKSRPFADDEGEESFGFDVLETIKAYSVHVLPGVAGVVFLFYGTYWFSSWIMTTKPDRPELGVVTGIVTLDGKPLAGATVTFQPARAKQPGSRVGASLGRTDGSGKYSLIYVRDVYGAALGKHKVMVQATDDQGRERLPAHYNSHTALVYDVQPGSNTIDLKLKSTR